MISNGKEVRLYRRWGKLSPRSNTIRKENLPSSVRILLRGLALMASRFLGMPYKGLRQSRTNNRTKRGTRRDSQESQCSITWRASKTNQLIRKRTRLHQFPISALQYPSLDRISRVPEALKVKSSVKAASFSSRVVERNPKRSNLPTRRKRNQKNGKREVSDRSPE